MSETLNLIPVNKIWLMPGKAVPCCIYFYFRGKYVKAIDANGIVSIDFLSKLAKVKYSYAYIPEETAQQWEDWTKERHPQFQENNSRVEETTNKELSEGKGAFISYAQKQIVCKNPTNKTLVEIEKSASELFRKVANNPLLEWFFLEWREKEDLFRHNARITYLTILFSLAKDLGNENEIEAMAFASIIHELEGDPKESLMTGTSERCLDIIAKDSKTIPAKVLDIIGDHDELCNGRGIPNKKKMNQISTQNRAFSICNHFDHIRLKFHGSRRDRLNSTKKEMEKNLSSYDPILFNEFWDFITKDFEIIS